MMLRAISANLMKSTLTYALCFALSVLPVLGQSQSASAPPASGPQPSKEAEQPKEPAATIAVNVSVVTLPVTVRDKHGQIVKDLTKDDFTLQENGRAQTINYFSRDANLPLTLGLLVDTSFSQREVLDQERNASKSFFDQMLAQEKDKAFLIQFDREVELLQDLTRSREKLQSALELLKTADPDREQSNSRSGSNSPSDHSYRHGGTQLYDAVYLASNEVLKKQTGRKAVVILSDGVDRGSKSTLESAIEAAQRTNTIVYAIYFKGHEEHGGHDQGMGRGGGYPGGGGGWPGGGGGWPGGGGGYPGGGRRSGNPRPEEPRVDGKKILERISKETGGRLFEASKKDALGEIYASIADELRTQYSLGFTPDKDAASEGYHHLALQVKKKDMTVQTRDGYYAGGES